MDGNIIFPTLKSLYVIWLLEYPVSYVILPVFSRNCIHTYLDFCVIIFWEIISWRYFTETITIRAEIIVVVIIIRISQHFTWWLLQSTKTKIHIFAIKTAHLHTEHLRESFKHWQAGFTFLKDVWVMQQGLSQTTSHMKETCTRSSNHIFKHL